VTIADSRCSSVIDDNLQIKLKRYLKRQKPLGEIDYVKKNYHKKEQGFFLILEQRLLLKR